jgi:tetratricopeptide (TPR) repeat protein
VEETFPVPWAIIQQGLSLIYAMRSEGDKSANLQQAITRGQSSLRVLTRAAYPLEWAGTHTHLAEAYRQATDHVDLCELYSGRSIMQEQALRHLEAALQIYTLQHCPLEWAKAQLFLGMVYLDRDRGKRSENLEQAKESFEAVLQVYPREFSPLDWAATQTLLGNVFLAREDERKECIEKAIACYQASLKVYSSTNYPDQWATNQFNLRCAYSLIENPELL